MIACFKSDVVGGHINEAGGITLNVESETEKYSVSANHVVNCSGELDLSIVRNFHLFQALVMYFPLKAYFSYTFSEGLRASSLARKILNDCDPRIPTTYFAKGIYYRYIGMRRHLYKHLIYPLPSGGGLGIHATLDLQGGVKYGPNVEWEDTTDRNEQRDMRQIYTERSTFNVVENEERKKIFLTEIQKYTPCVQHGISSLLIFLTFFISFFR
jgi:L-2-hydroxyglutarate oxidase LhgO